MIRTSSPTLRTLARALCVLSLCAAAATHAQNKTVVTLGTATPGGGFPVYGEAFAGVINQTDPTLELKPVNTKGSTENVPLLEAGKLDIALATGEVTYEALRGIGRPPAKIAIVAAMYSQAGFFAVRADSPYKSIADLRGKPVVWGARGSGFVVLARYMLDGLGLDIEKDFQAIYLDRAGDGPAMVLDGRAAAMWGGGSGWPAFTEIAKGPNGARFIAPTSAEVQRIAIKHDFLQRLTTPARSYPGQDAPIESLGSWSFVLARPDLPDDVAYRIARAIHKGEAAFGQRLAQARETTAANTVAAVPRPEQLHPGVRKYLKEAGLLK
jgi:TRAP transporter TAXI family solute receptor